MNSCFDKRLARAAEYARQGVRSGVLDNLTRAADKARESGARGLANALECFRNRAADGEDIAAELSAFANIIIHRARR